MTGESLPSLSRQRAYNSRPEPRRPVLEEDSMFTGIIESIGSIRALTPKGGDVRVYVETGKLDLSDVKLGDSIAVNGVCLTAVELPGNGFAADVSRETLDCTAMNDLKAGSPVNLEKALTPTTQIGRASCRERV